MNRKKDKECRLEILALEDSPMDADLIYEYLCENSRHEIQMDIVLKEDEFVAAISSKKYDLILADYMLPGFNGFAALKHVKSICPSTPFICVSGFIGEGKAVELLKQGATDYVSKDKLGLLIYSIERALKVTKEQEVLVKSQLSLIESEAKHKAMIANSSDVISIIDQNGVIKYTSPNITKWFGWKTNELVGTNVQGHIYPDDRLEYKRKFQDLLEKDGLEKTADYRIKCKDATYKCVKVTAVNLMQNPNIRGILINCHDITDIKNREKEILYLGYHDYLTDLYNRTYFEEEKKRLDTIRQLPISIIMGDINGLKLINDGFGHSKGDEVLIEMAKILKSCCREEDIVARIGGDEFGILLPQTDSQLAQLVCSRISDACKGYSLNGTQIYPSISLGHATKNIETETIKDILMVAEESMSRHKLLESKSAHSSIMASIKVIMFEKSQETEEHAERLVQLSKSIGIAMSLTDDQLNELELLSTLHDIGKMSVDADVLSKPGKLNNEEWNQMRKHPEVGFRIAQATSELIPIAKYILCHHERWDGKGYPQGLIGENIPLLSRILAIVDSFDAMSNNRSYRSAMTKGEVIEEIRRNSGTQFDPNISQLFLNIISPELTSTRSQLFNLDLINIPEATPNMTPTTKQPHRQVNSGI